MLDHAAIETLIPHRGAMCLLDRLVDWTPDRIACTAVGHVDPTNPLRTRTGLLSVTGIEYAAQAMALHGALLAQAAGAIASPGFLASARGVTLHRSRLDDLPGPLDIAATRQAGDAQQLLYGFEIRHGGVLVVEGRVAVVLGVALPVPGAPQSAA